MTSGAFASSGRRATPMTLRSRTTIRDVRTSKLAPVHPGEVLLEEFLKPFGISQYRLSKDIQVPPRRINEIVHGPRAISADPSLRLARSSGTSALFWTNLYVLGQPVLANAEGLEE